MTGDLIFLDFEKRKDEEKEVSKSPSKLPLPQVKKEESRSEKIKRLAAQIESGEFEVDSEKVADQIIKEFSDFQEPE